MGPFLIKFLMIQYVGIAIAFGVQGDWARVEYFIGALILSHGILMMK